MTKKLTKKAAVENLQQVAKKLGHAPSRAEYRARKNKNNVASSSIESVFKGSWSSAKKQVRL